MSEPSEKPDQQGPGAETPALSQPDSSLASASAATQSPQGPTTSPEASAAVDPVASVPAEAEPGATVTDPAATAPELASDAAAADTVVSEPAPLTPEQIEVLAKRRRDKTLGLVLVTVTFVLSMIGSLYAKKLAEPEISQPPGPPTTEGVENWPKQVDPLQALSVAREATRRNLLRGFVVEMVKSDGTVDFTKKGRRVRYSFQSEPGHGPQPARQPGTQPRRTYCGKQNVHIRELGVVADPDMASYPCSAKEKEPLPDPSCTLKQVWEYALKKGAPKKKVARIEYYRAEAGPAYRFSLPGTRYRFSLYGDCSRELKGRDAAGGVP